MPEKPICFVIAAIGEDGSEIRNRAERVFTYLIEPVAAAHGYHAVRSPEGVSTPICVAINRQALRKSSEPVVAQLAELVQHLSEGFAALRSDVADLRDRQSGPVSFSPFGGTGGFKVGAGWSPDDVAKLSTVLPLRFNVR